MQNRRQKHTLGQTLSLFRSFFPYFRPYMGVMVLDLFCASLTTICDLVLPLIVRYITGAATDGTTLLVSTVLKLGLIYLVLRTSSRICAATCSRTCRISRTAIMTTRRSAS